MAVKFQQFYVQNGDKKARVHYSGGAIVRGGVVINDVITIYASDYDRSLGRVFDGVDGVVYQNETDLMTDYFDRGLVRIFAYSPLYPAALARLKANEAKWEQRQAEAPARRAAAVARAEAKKAAQIAAYQAWKLAKSQGVAA